MSGSAWTPKNKTPEQMFEDAIMAPEYYDLDVPSLEQFKKEQWDKLKTKPEGMAANWAWNIRMDKEYKEKYKSV